ncbi:MAG: ATP-binding protein [Rhodocyclales bacterium]|nr:ATP-binding protein [Rhodocyclales bacterium]
MIPRLIASHLIDLAGKYPVVTVTGPRQSGKTTLLRRSFPGKPYVNFEAPDTRARFLDDPRGFLSHYPDGAVFDEFQRIPDLPSWLQVLVDENPQPGRFLLTGSQQLEVMSRVSQSLAGRTALLKLLPLAIEELANAGIHLPPDRLIFAGGYPRIHALQVEPGQMLADYFETFVQRDLRQLAEIRDLGLFERFVRLCAGRVGQLLNLNNLASDTGVSQPTARAWLTLLEASYVVFLLQPYHANMRKRLTRSPKLYFHDVGLASFLLGIDRESQVALHPLRGPLFENLAVTEMLKWHFNRGRRAQMSFYRDLTGLEVDLLVERPTRPMAIEVKSGATVSGDMLTALRRHAAAVPTATDTIRMLVYSGELAATQAGIWLVPLVDFPTALTHADNSP